MKLQIKACRLRDLKNGQFQLHFQSGGAFQGTFREITKKALNKGIPVEDLVQAFSDLESWGRDYAEFGVTGTYLYSASDERLKVS